MQYVANYNVSWREIHFSLEVLNQSSGFFHKIPKILLLFLALFEKCLIIEMHTVLEVQGYRRIRNYEK